MSLRFPGASVGTETWPQDDVHKQVTNYKLHPPPTLLCRVDHNHSCPPVTQAKDAAPGWVRVLYRRQRRGKAKGQRCVSAAPEPGLVLPAQPAALRGRGAALAQRAPASASLGSEAGCRVR